MFRNFRIARYNVRLWYYRRKLGRDGADNYFRLQRMQRRSSQMRSSRIHKGFSYGGRRWHSYSAGRARNRYF